MNWQNLQTIPKQEKEKYMYIFLDFNLTYSIYKQFSKFIRDKIKKSDREKYEKER